MRIGIGLGIGFQRYGGGASGPFMLSSGQWEISERTEDVNTRQVQIDIYRNPPAGFRYIWYRGKAAFATPTTGNFGATTNLGGGHWRGQAAGKTTMGTVDLVRVFLVPVGVSDPVAWNNPDVVVCVPVEGIKEFSPSTVPDTPVIASYVPDGDGGADITFETPDGNGRTVTGGSWRLAGGSYATFTGTSLNIPAVEDGQTVQVYWTNVNGNSSVLSQILYLLDEPVAPEAYYLIDGSGTAATVYLSPPEGFDTSGLTGARWQIDGGSWTEQAELFEIDLTGLDPDQEVGVAWENAAGWSETTSFTLIASPPTFDSDDWDVANEEDAAGDVFSIDISSNPASIPAGINFLGAQYSLDLTTWTDIGTTPLDVSTGTPGVAETPALRAIYNIGPSIPSATKSVTPDYPPIVTEFPLDTDWTSTASGATSVSSMAVGMPTRTPGQIIFGYASVNMDGSITNISLTKDIRATGEWTLHQDGTTTNASLWTFYKVCEFSDEVLTIVPASAEQMVTKVKAIDGGRFEDIVRGTGTTGLNPAAISWAETEKALLLTAIAYSGAVANVSGAPSGWAAQSLTGSGSTAATGVRLAVSNLDSESTGVDPGAWSGGSATTRTVTYAILPVTSVPPVTTVSVELSATEVDNGESITWVTSADGRDPRTYELTVDGDTYENSTGVFTLTPSQAAGAWSMLVSNVAGSASDSGTITVREGIIITISETSVLEITVEADSVTHSVTAASYELEIQEADGTPITLMAQPGPYFDVTFPGNGAYRYRPIAVASGGARSYGDWFYYAAFVQGLASFAVEGALEAQIGPLSANEPIEVVPLPGREVKTHVPWPPHYTVVAGGRTHHLNGVMFNPSAQGGRGPHAWDSRTIGSGRVLGAYMTKFDPALLHTSWPQRMGIGDTVSKFISRPTAQMPDVGEAHRHGLSDQQAGLIVKSALSTSSPMQGTPAIIKHEGWLEASVDLPGYADMVDQVVESRLSVTGMSVPNVAQVVAKLIRFDPANKLLRGANHNGDHGEAFRPYHHARSTSVANYRSYELDNWAVCLALSDATTSDQSLQLVNSWISRGIQCDLRMNNFRIGAGISQANLLPVSMARIAQGIPFDDLETTQSDNAPFQYGYWTEEYLEYLEPHNNITRPLFARRKQITAVNANAGGGHRFVIPFDLSAGTGERQQDFNGLNIFRESTLEELPYTGSSGRKDGPTLELGTVGTFSTMPTVGEWVYMKIPDSIMPAFVEGMPFWMYDTDTRPVDTQWDWNSFNPTPGMSYRDINKPQGPTIMLHALGAYPDIPGSKWNAMKDYQLLGRTNTFPAAGWRYPFTDDGFVTQFWDAHAATLGITL